MFTPVRSVLSIAAATGLLCLAAPPSVADGPDARIRSLGAPSPGPSPDVWLRGSKATSHHTLPDQPAPTVVREVRVDDDAVEYLQIGLGALAGVTVASAAGVGLRRLRHPAPHPA